MIDNIIYEMELLLKLYKKHDYNVDYLAQRITEWKNELKELNNGRV